MTSTKINTKIWRIVWILTSLIGFIGFVSLSLDPAFSQEGFNAPARRSFGTPGSANVPPADFFDDEDDEFKDDFFTDVPPAAANRNTPEEDEVEVPSIGGKNAANESKKVAPDSDGIDLEGEHGTGVVSHNKQKAIKVDTETGSGSKDVITDFNYPDADIMDLAKTLGKLTGKNFIVDKDVKGRVTIISNAPITVSDAWKAFLTALDMNGFTVIPSGQYIRIARQRDARDKQIRTYTGESSPDTDALVTRVFALKYIGADEISRVFRSFSPANARIIAHEQTNTVIVTDTGSNISKLSKMLDFLDVEGFDAGIEVIPVKYASAVDLSKLIDTLIPGTGAAAGAPKAPGGGFGGRGGNFQARRTKEGGLINTIISDERTNTLIVHANGKGAQQVRELVAKLDKRLPAQIGGGKIHVVYLQFADAEEVGKTLNNFSQAAGSKSPTASAGAGAGIGVNPQETQLFEGQIKVSADKSTNSLVITASMTDFITVQRVINKLDIPRDEVYTEVVIMELGVQKNFDYNVNVGVASNNMIAGSLPSGDILSYFQNPLSGKGAVIPFMTGGSQTLTIGGSSINVGTVQGLVRALQTNGNASVLATPQIMTLDNMEATFESTEKIPVPQVNAVAGGVTQTGVSYQDVTLSIKIKPQINKLSNFVKLAIDTKMSDFSGREPPAQVAGLAFATLERRAKTDLVVGDSDTVVMGGLIRDKIIDSVSKIPIIGDIPLLGWLFRSKRSETSKSNLVMLITPHIIRQYEKVRALLDRKLKDRDDFIEKSAGGEDPHRSYRDKIIRSLPDVKNLSSYKPKKSVTLGEELDQQERMNEEPEAKTSVVPERDKLIESLDEKTSSTTQKPTMDSPPKPPVTEAISTPEVIPEALPPIELPPTATPGQQAVAPSGGDMKEIPAPPPLQLEPPPGSGALAP
ncbi:MAG: type II secretion system secretin GspD [Xanthomonadaceae bacterium]|nr:type II secretion system secretin GspD [Xanthomonadaceae bacterium]